jgi:hypothetical protein
MKSLNPIYSLDRYENVSEKDFYKKKRQVFILTEAGKPVYSRYGNEVNLGNLTAAWSVIIYKMSNHRGPSQPPNNLHCVTTNVNRTFFLKKNSLYFIMVTTKRSDTPLQIQTVLQSLAFQIDFSLTLLYQKSLGTLNFRKKIRG